VFRLTNSAYLLGVCAVFLLNIFYCAAGDPWPGLPPIRLPRAWKSLIMHRFSSWRCLSVLLDPAWPAAGVGDRERP
jgi:hypothetical protein